MFKKAIIALSLLAPLACGAQVMEKFPGLQLNKLSENGRYISEAINGVCIYDRQTKETYNYNTSYALGGGRAISNNGIAVGSTGNYTVPSYWQNGEWKALPNSVGASVSYGRADDITPDGKYIVGTMDCRPQTKKAWPMVSPVIWTLNESTGQYEFAILPEPDKDIATCSPQQISASYISADGKTVLGQITDFRGLLTNQIVYRLGEDGTWTYELSGDNRLVKEGAEWPEYPIQPKKPQLESYLTNEEILAFNKANQAYKDSLEIVSLTGKNPRMPWPQDFLKERKDEYDAAMTQYEQDSSDYLTKLRAFQDAYRNNLTNDVFEFNSHVMSLNAQYYSANYVYTGPADETNPAPTYVAPIIYSMDGSVPERVIENSSMSLFSVLNNGSIIACTPCSDDYVLARTPYIIPIGEEPMLYKNWVETNHPEVYKWMKENICYDVDASESDSGQPETDVMMCGSVRMNSDATKAIAYYVEPGKNTYASYVVDFTAEPVSVAAPTVAPAVSVYTNTAADTLYFNGNPELVEIFDLSGRCLYSGTPGTSLAAKALGISGVCLVRLHADNTPVTQKVIIK